MIGSPFNDTLIGRDGGSTFQVTGPNQGDLDGNFLFVSIEKLQGGAIPTRLITARCPVRCRLF